MNINIESYFNDIKKMGIEITIPIIIEIPCPKCRMVEVYAIYPNNYQHIKSYKYGSNEDTLQTKKDML